MKTKNVTEKNMKVCLVGSSGGHLTHLYMLKPFWKDKNRFWVTFDQKMGWDSECRYKMLGYRITFEGETLYVFDLLVPEIFHEGQRKKNAVDSQDNAASTKPVNSRKGFYLDDIVGTFGVPVEEHRKESEVKQMDGYVSMGILTGKIAPEAGKD